MREKTDTLPKATAKRLPLYIWVAISWKILFFIIYQLIFDISSKTVKYMELFFRFVSLILRSKH